ncbi:MAG: hypothetical protein ABW056_12835 [Thermoanaerobaculia bacterium]
MRRIGGRIGSVVLALQMAAGLLVPLSAFAMGMGTSRGTAVMACCMMHGRCDCGHSDASFARCTGQNVAPVFAAPAAPLPAAAGRLASTSPGPALTPENETPSGLFDSVPPTPPPRAA